MQNKLLVTTPFLVSGMYLPTRYFNNDVNKLKNYVNKISVCLVFRCGPCPVGYDGSEGFSGVGLDYASRQRQVCSDINECNKNNGNCVSNSVCINNPGSFECGQCVRGFVGNQEVGCSNR